MIRIVASDPTAEELRAVLSHPDAFYEVVDGRIVEKPQMSAFSLLIARTLYEALSEFCGHHAGGAAFLEFTFVLDPTRPLKRRPDVAYVSFERWPADREIPEDGDWEVVPDLAVEVVSPRDLHQEIALKVLEDFRHGMKQVWVVHPGTREVYIHEAPKRVKVLDEQDVLDGGAILPGFRLPVADLFRRTVGR